MLLEELLVLYSSDNLVSCKISCCLLIRIFMPPILHSSLSWCSKCHRLGIITAESIWLLQRQLVHSHSKFLEAFFPTPPLANSAQKLKLKLASKPNKRKMLLILQQYPRLPKAAGMAAAAVAVGVSLHAALRLRLINLPGRVRYPLMSQNNQPSDYSATSSTDLHDTLTEIESRNHITEA